MMNKQKGNMYGFVTHTWNPVSGACQHKCTYCIVENTRILMGDFSVKNIQDVKVSDKIIGINRGENNQGYSKFGVFDVVNTSKRSADTIVLDTKKSTIECTPEHILMGSTKIRKCNDWKQAKTFSPYENLRFIGEQSVETDEFLIGWLKGFCDGDGCFFKHYNEYKKEYMGFEAICIDKQLRDSVICVASKFGIELKVGEKISSIKSFNKGKKNKMIFSRRSDNVKKLKELIKFDDNKHIEYYKGYLGGMLDADGSVSQFIVRISQSKSHNNIKYERIRTCLHAMSIKYTEEKDVFLLRGGFQMRVKLLFESKPKHSRKSIRLIMGCTTKGAGHSEITNISIGRKNVDVYNLETTCGNFIANGFIVHNCYMKVWPQKELNISTKILSDDLGSNNVIFVGSSTDMFADNVPHTWIYTVLSRCEKYQENTYLFQTKNPEKFFNFRNKFPKNTVLCTTIETNRTRRFDIKYDISDAPNVHDRIKSLSSNPMKNFKKAITIEPIMDFDLDELVSMIERVKPEWVAIGADSKNHNLPEPSEEKIQALIDELNKFTDVRIKDNLKRLWKERVR